LATPTLYWHDYETFGIDPQRDRPAQFAGIRTDTEFNILDDPLVIYCKLSADNLPSPDACLITRITPQKSEQLGICEAEFIRTIHFELAQPNTCALGYNSIRFDDEVTRNCLYRNFYEPYAREWQNGNSRWDLLDVARAARALRPEGIVWPYSNDGKPSFRLDQLTVANDICHDNAHDALSDVYATIAIAKLIKYKQPRLYDFLWQHRTKENALKLLQLGNFRPLVHISGKYPSIKHCLAVVVPICKHPTNNNGIIVYDLSVNPEPILDLSIEKIRERIFTATENMPEGIDRIPLKTVHINKCPVLAPISVIRPEDAERLQIDLNQCKENLAAIKYAPDLSVKLSAVFAEQKYISDFSDPDLAIYSGGFFSDADKRLMNKIINLSQQELANTAFNYNDTRLPEMLFRFRARNYPQTLTALEAKVWQDFCINRLMVKQQGCGLTIEEYFQQLQVLKNTADINIQIVDELMQYGMSKLRELKLEPIDVLAPAIINSNVV
jgi:exodeoxyribonuclease-1